MVNVYKYIDVKLNLDLKIGLNSRNALRIDEKICLNRVFKSQSI